MSAKKLFLVGAITLVVAFATACENETLVTKVDPTQTPFAKDGRSSLLPARNGGGGRGPAYQS